MDRRIIESQITLRSEGEGEDYIEGYGIVFNTRSVEMRTKSGQRFVEEIKPSAVEGIEGRDIIGLANHDFGQVLGRTKSGTMTISVDERGVKYSIKIPNTPTGNDIREYIKRGDITGSSFSFSEAQDEVEKLEGGVFLRTITKLPEIIDMGPVYYPAYPDSTSGYAVRSIDNYKEDIEENVGLKETDRIKLKLKLKQL